MRSRTAAASLLSFALDIGTKWYHTQVDTVPTGTTSPEAINAERRGSPNRARCALSGDRRWITESNRKGDAYVAAAQLLWEHRIQRDRVGDGYGTLHLAATAPSTTVGGVATAAHPPQLPLHRLGLPGPRRRVT